MRTVQVTVLAFLIALAGLRVPAQSEARYRLDIPSQPIKLALRALGEQTGIQILFRSEDVAREEAATPRITGEMSVAEALQRLLENAPGLKCEWMNPHTVLVSARERVTQGRWTSQTDAEIAGVASSPAAAAGTSAPAPRDPVRDAIRPEGVSQVIVTAQKRTERLQDVPLSVQVIDGSVIAQRNRSSLVDLAETVPGLHIDTGGPSNRMVIRGIGSAGNQSFDQSVGLFVDDVYHGRSRTSQALLFDIDRIEVLKGPQSTYFGNNAIAGAISITTRKPGDSLSTEARALYGQHGRYAIEGAVGGPFNETLGVRVAGTYNGGDGWIDNLTTGRKVPQEDNVAGRLTLSFTPADTLHGTLKIEGGRSELRGASFGGPFQLSTCPVPSTWPRTFDAVCERDVPIGLDDDRNIDSGRGRHRLSIAEAVLTTAYDRGGAAFTSVSGFYDYSWDLDFPNPEGPGLGTTTFAPENARQLSQEFRVASLADRRLAYLAGIYFQNVAVRFRLGNVYTELSVPDADPLQPYLPLGKQSVNAQDENSYAVFGAFTFNATDRLKLIGGLRATRVEKTFDRTLYYGRAEDVFGGIAPGMPFTLQAAAARAAEQQAPLAPIRVSAADEALLPSARLQYQFTPEVMVYAAYDRGFKTGGFNGSDSTNDPANFPFGPEHVDSYQLGLKSEWLERRLLVNVDVFRSIYRDLQVGFFVPSSSSDTATSLTRNAGASRSQGVEAEIQWVPDSTFRLSANVAWLDARYTDYRNSSGTITQIFRGMEVQDISGQTTSLAPRWSGSVTATHEAVVPGGRVICEVSPYFTSRYNLADIAEVVDGRFLFGQRGYVRLDARIGYERDEGRWTLELIGRNLTDRIIATSYGSLLTTSKLEPRNLAAQVRFNW